MDRAADGSASHCMALDESGPARGRMKVTETFPRFNWY